MVEQLDDDALAAEPVDEPVELPSRRHRAGFDEHTRHRPLAAARQDEKVAFGELGQAVEVVAGAPLLAAGEVTLADGAGEP